jgi:hypothetical protein
MGGDANYLRTHPEGLAWRMELMIVPVVLWTVHLALQSVLIVARAQTGCGRVVAEYVNLLCLVMFGYMEGQCQRTKSLKLETCGPA